MGGHGRQQARAGRFTELSRVVPPFLCGDGAREPRSRPCGTAAGFRAQLRARLRLHASSPPRKGGKTRDCPPAAPDGPNSFGDVRCWFPILAVASHCKLGVKNKTLLLCSWDWKPHGSHHAEVKPAAFWARDSVSAFPSPGSCLRPGLRRSGHSGVAPPSLPSSPLAHLLWLATSARMRPLG